MTLKAIIIDDEESARETLTKLIEKYTNEVEIVAEAYSVELGIKAIIDFQPDVVFLDIRLSPGTGFDILEKLPNINAEIIFTTAYDRYAMKAIKFSALDYLLKPINPSELKIAIEKVRKNRLLKNNSINSDLSIFNEFLKNQQEQLSKIVLHTSEGHIVLKIVDIIRCEGYKNYTTFYLENDKKIVVGKTLKEYEEMLEGHRFIRIFQSHLVSLNHIKKYKKGRGGLVEMSDGSILQVSRDKKAELLDRLDNLQQ